MQKQELSRYWGRSVVGSWAEYDCEDLPLPLAYAGDKKVKRFHFSEIIGRLPYMRATVTPTLGMRSPSRAKKALYSSNFLQLDNI